ncbi:MAG TPA: hypothetical protein VFC03_06705 [Acidimicrobiales bacterium]|nr:hypothetical protein [Acidimicrobiales bacterium]
MSDIEMQDQTASWCRQGCGLVIRERTAHQRGGDARDLVPINETQAMLRGDCNAVEEVQLRYLKNMLDLAERRPR